MENENEPLNQEDRRTLMSAYETLDLRIIELNKATKCYESILPLFNKPNIISDELLSDDDYKADTITLRETSLIDMFYIIASNMARATDTIRNMNNEILNIIK